MLLKLELRRSYYLLTLLLLLYGGAIAISLLLALPWWLKIVIVCGCLFSMIHTIKHHALRTSASAANKIWVENNHMWYIQQGNSTIKLAQLRGDSICTPLLVILNFKKTVMHGKVSIVIWCDTIPADDFRRLRKYLLATRYQQAS